MPDVAPIGQEIRCPCCGEVGRLLVFYPTGHAMVVHPGAFLESGRQQADSGCLVGDEALAALEDAR